MTLFCRREWFIDHVVCGRDLRRLWNVKGEKPALIVIPDAWTKHRYNLDNVAVCLFSFVKLLQSKRVKFHFDQDTQIGLAAAESIMPKTNLPEVTGFHFHPQCKKVTDRMVGHNSQLNLICNISPVNNY